MNVFSHSATHHRGLAAQASSWLFRLRLAREVKRFQAMPPHLLQDVGLPGFHELSDDARRAALAAALRKS